MSRWPDPDELRAQARADQERQMDQAEYDARTIDPTDGNDGTICVYCGRRWFTSHMLDRTFIARYLPEAGAVCHIICHSRKQAEVRDDAVKRYLRKAVP